MKTIKDMPEDLGRLEASAGQLLTAIQWLASNLEAEAAQGRGLGLAMAVQLGGPVRALSAALLSINYGVSELLAAAETELRAEAARDPVVAEELTELTTPTSIGGLVETSSREMQAPVTVQ